MHATTLDLRAVGWVITRDAFAELTRVKLGRGRRIDARVLRAVAAQWRALEDRQAQPGQHASVSRLSLDALPLSPQASYRLAAILRELGARWPAQYGVPALRRRGVLAATQSGIGFAAGLVLSGTASAESTTWAGVALVMLVMGFWSLAIASQLWRTWRMARDAMQSSASAGIADAPPVPATTCMPTGDDAASANWRGEQPHERP